MMEWRKWRNGIDGMEEWRNGVKWMEQFRATGTRALGDDWKADRPDWLTE